MYAAASRRHALFPFSGMFSSIKHPYLVSLKMTGLSSVLDRGDDMHESCNLIIAQILLECELHTFSLNFSFSYD